MKTAQELPIAASQQDQRGWMSESAGRVFSLDISFIELGRQFGSSLKETPSPSFPNLIMVGESVNRNIPTVEIIDKRCKGVLLN